MLLFDLAVGLWIEGGKNLSLNAKEVIKPGPKLEGENRLPIADDRVGKTVVFCHNVYNYLRKVWSIDSNFNQLMVYYLG